jgi:hypothetical protein
MNNLGTMLAGIGRKIWWSHILVMEAGNDRMLVMVFWVLTLSVMFPFILLISQHNF